MIRIGIVGCGRILNAHLQGYLQLRRLGIDTFRITALCARKVDDALMFRKRGEGPPPRPRCLTHRRVIRLPHRTLMSPTSTMMLTSLSTPTTAT